MGMRREFLSLMAFWTALAIPALGQVVAPAVVPAGGAGQSAAPIPDFSGIWAHRREQQRSFQSGALSDPAGGQAGILRGIDPRAQFILTVGALCP